MQSRILNNKYELLSKVGEGGMSTVYLARDLTLNKNWAIKEVLKEGLLAGQKTSNDLLTEAKMMKNLDHPSLPRIVDIIEQEDRYYIVMDYVEGQTLQDLIDQRGAQGQTQVIKWALELAAVLYYLHSLDPPIIYRDMKPANVILQPNGSLKVIDFGIARTFEAAKTEDTVALGSKGFAAPEQYYNSGRVTKSDARTDIFNLGATMYTLLTTKTLDDKPYKFVPIREIDPGFSAGFEKIITKATQSDPDDRFQSAEEMMQALLNFEKLDDVYIYDQRMTLKKVMIPFIIGVCLLFLGVAGFITNTVMNKNTYEHLLLDTGDRNSRVENLSKAISLRPSDEKAYNLLVEELSEDSDGLTEEDAQIIMSIYNENQDELKKDTEKYLDVNFDIGQSFLVYFTGKSDNSIRNRLLTAYPFFDAVYQSGQTEYENYSLAKTYVTLGDFYKNYIVGKGTNFTKAAGKEEYSQLIKTMKEAVRDVDSATERNPQLCLVTYETCLNILQSERSGIAFSLSKEDVYGLINTIYEKTKSVPAADEKGIEEKDKVLKQCKTVKSDLEVAYDNRRKEEKR